jgi:shikimate kinase
MIDNKNIILCGFMGSGKTTVGRLLANLTNRQFVDMDSYIESQQQTTISQIFKDFGEETFRDLETKAAMELSKENGFVIATGGGTLTFQNNVDIFKTNGVIVLLDAPLAAIKERLKGDTTRPLLQSSDRNAVIDELYQKRIASYQNAADLIIPAGAPAQAVADLIAEKIDES